jgi:hypothetical protein
MAQSERGQATVEWAALVMLLALALLTVGFVVSRSGALGLGRSIVDAIVCAAGDACPGALEDAYGEELAKTVRRYAPNIVYERRSAQLPVDFRRCRKTTCSNGVDRAETVSESWDGLPVTAFTHVVDLRSEGGPLYLQYWLYFPESFTGGIGRTLLGRYEKEWPGYHADDWEGLQIRISGDGTRLARATAHGGYKNFADSEGWGPWTGWYRISGGSHAGHLVERPGGERTTPGSSLRLVPLERMSSQDLYRFEVSPPWRKTVYTQPESTHS